MKRLAVGIALAVLLPNCIQANPVAQEQKSAEQQLRDSIGPWCAEICQHGIDCQQETSHLASLGARPISRRRFASHLAELIDSNAAPGAWPRGGLSSSS